MLKFAVLQQLLVKELCCYMAQKEKMSTVTKQGRDREYFVCLTCVVGIKNSSLCSAFSLFTYLHRSQWSPSILHSFLLFSLFSFPVFHALCAQLHSQGMSGTLCSFSTSLTITICWELQLFEFHRQPLNPAFGTITIPVPRESRAKENVCVKSCADYLVMITNGMRQLYG